MPWDSEKVLNREVWLRPTVSTMLPCFYCPSSSHAWNIPFSGISFTFLAPLRKTVECKIVSPETTKLKGEGQLSHWTLDQSELYYILCFSASWSFTLLSLVHSNHWKNSAGEICFWLVIRHKRKFWLSSLLIAFPLTYACSTIYIFSLDFPEKALFCMLHL